MEITHELATSSRLAISTRPGTTRPRQPEYSRILFGNTVPHKVRRSVGCETDWSVRTELPATRNLIVAPTVQPLQSLALADNSPARLLVRTVEQMACP